MDEAELAEAISGDLEKHAASCEVGPRVCVDCMLAGSGRARTALARAAVIAQEALDALAALPVTLCVYCGELATSRDHLIPKGWSGKAARKWVPTVPACQDCNGRIGTTPDMGIAARAAVAAESLRKKHARALTRADRTPAELAEYGDHIRSGLIARQERRQQVRGRLVVLDMGGMPTLPAEWRRAIAAGANPVDLKKAA